MQILKHFNREDKEGLIVYKLKQDELEDFLSKLTEDFRLCYIKNEDLQKKCVENKLSADEFLEKYIIPDKGNIKSGDFGEIFSYFMVIENQKNKGIILNGPLKWQWKENKNKAMLYADSIMFNVKSGNSFSEKDLLVTVESKMKAVPSKNHRIQDAIDGAALDKLTRLSKTLIWLEEKYARLGDFSNRKLVERFKDPATYGNYQKLHKAIAILDCECEAGELDRDFKNEEKITVIAFSMKDLKAIYEKVHLNMIKSVT
jgi:hypothetical protein